MARGRRSTVVHGARSSRRDGDGATALRCEPARDNHRPKPNTPAAKEVKPLHTPPYGEIALTRGPMGQLQEPRPVNLFIDPSAVDQRQRQISQQSDRDLKTSLVRRNRCVHHTPCMLPHINVHSSETAGSHWLTHSAAWSASWRHKYANPAAQRSMLIMRRLHVRAYSSSRSARR